MARVLLTIALAFHAAGVAAAATGELRHLPAVSRAGALMLAAAWAGELMTLIVLGVSAGAFPLRNGPEYLLGLGWFVLTLHLVLWFRSETHAAGLVLPPVALLLAGCALLLAVGRQDVSPLSTQRWFVLHTSLATAGVGALAVSFAMGLMFLVKERALKSKRPLRVLEMLPTLEALDRTGFRALLYGFPLLTLGIATGMVYSSAEHGSPWIWGAKEIFPVIAWIVFAVLLWGRSARVVNGRRSAMLAITGFAFALLTFLGMVR